MNNYGNNQRKHQGNFNQEGVNEREKVIENIKNNILQILDAEKDPEGTFLVESAEKLGKHLADQGMSTSQIRNLFFEIKNIDFAADGPYKLNIARAKLAYIAGKHERQVKDLQRVLDEAIKKVGTSQVRFRRFLDFFEAIVAYHRSYRKKDD